MRTITVLLIITASAFYFGCSEDSVSSDSTSLKSLFPLKIGNKWTIAEIRYDTNGIVTRSDTNWIHIDSTGSIGDLQGVFWNSSQDEVRFAFYSGSDLKIYHPDAKIFFLLLRYPMNVNDEVIIRDTIIDNDRRAKSILRLASNNTSVTVPAGTFKCYNYETIHLYGKGTALDTSGIQNLYVSSGVGLVKQDEFDYTSITRRKYLYQSTRLIKFEKD